MCYALKSGEPFPQQESTAFSGNTFGVDEI